MSGRSKAQVSANFIEVGPKGWFGLPNKVRLVRTVLLLILVIGTGAGIAFLLRTKEPEVSAEEENSHRTQASQFDLSVERIYRFDHDNWTVDPDYNIGKDYKEFKWSPFDEEYGAGYIDVGNGIISRTCSHEVPGETGSTVTRRGKKCYFPGGEETKNLHNYFDAQNGGHRFGELFDVRMYLWSLFGSCNPSIVVGEGGTTDDNESGQFRFPSAFGRGCYGAVAVEFHFYNRGTLYNLDGTHKSVQELSEDYLAKNEREFKGILRVDDIDTGFEGYTPTRGVEHLWVTKTTDLRITNYTKEQRDLLPANCTGSTAAICKHWIGMSNNDSGDSWRNNNAAIWMEFDGKSEEPFTLVYTTSKHGSSITSKMTVVNYVLVADEEDGFYPSLDPLFEAEETENNITRYDLPNYNIERINTDTQKTIKRFGVTTYSWYDPNYYPPGLPENCSIDGWYADPYLSTGRIQDSSELKDVFGRKLMILQNDPSDPGWAKEGENFINSNGQTVVNGGAYYFYGKAVCDPIHQIDNDTGCESGH